MVEALTHAQLAQDTLVLLSRLEEAAALQALQGGGPELQRLLAIQAQKEHWMQYLSLGLRESWRPVLEAPPTLFPAPPLPHEQEAYAASTEAYQLDGQPGVDWPPGPVWMEEDGLAADTGNEPEERVP